MGAPSYCRKCDRPLEFSTPQQVGDGEHECPYCNYTNDPNQSVGDLLRELTERVEALEAERK